MISNKTDLLASISNEIKRYFFGSIISITFYCVLFCLFLGIPTTIEMVQANPKLLLIYPFAIVLLSVALLMIEAVGKISGTIFPYVVQTPPPSNKMTRPSKSLLDTWVAQYCETFKHLITLIDHFLQISLFSATVSQEKTKNKFIEILKHSAAIKNRLIFNFLILFFPRKHIDTPKIA